MLEPLAEVREAHPKLACTRKYSHSRIIRVHSTRIRVRAHSTRICKVLYECERRAVVVEREADRLALLFGHFAPLGGRVAPGALPLGRVAPRVAQAHQLRLSPVRQLHLLHGRHRVRVAHHQPVRQDRLRLLRVRLRVQLEH